MNDPKRFSSEPTSNKKQDFAKREECGDYQFTFRIRPCRCFNYRLEKIVHSYRGDGAI